MSLRRCAFILGAFLVAGAAGAFAQNSITPVQPREYDCPGLGVAHGQGGEMCVGLWTYMRYINQMQLDTSYTDSFGRTISIKRRQDIQHQKVNLSFRGWIYDRRLLYRMFMWTANTSQGDANQLAMGGILAWNFGPKAMLSAGAGPVPSTRSTQGTFPNWLKVDHRTIADEYFRASYSTGIWVNGEAARGLKYIGMLSNNLSGYGVDALEMDNLLNTLSGAVWWMPTTKEYGPLEGMGDFEGHQRLATLIGLHFTRSREDRQSQPGTEDIDNTQLRISDGTNILVGSTFANGQSITAATYRMMSNEVGFKYRGYSLEGEYFTRWIDDLATTGPVPVSKFFDHGYQVNASAMLHPKTVQLYLAGSKIDGQYGRPWDISPGLNVFPFRDRRFRLAAQALYAYRSPVGYTAFPIPLGARGWAYTLDSELIF